MAKRKHNGPYGISLQGLPTVSVRVPLKVLNGFLYRVLITCNVSVQGVWGSRVLEDKGTS